MKQILLATLCLLGFSSLLTAQQHTGFGQHLQDLPHCGQTYFMQAMEQQYPGYNNAVNAAYRQAIDYAKTAPRNSEIYTIPVVVHIVYQSEAQNIPQAQIEAVIDNLNKDYRRLNADTMNTRETFQDVVGDPGIEFVLDHVERVSTTATFELDIFNFENPLPDNVKVTAEGGSDAWDTENYLNIWVCNIDGGFFGALLGYAYPPSGLANWPDGSNAPSSELEGVVIHYPAFNVGSTIDFGGQMVNIAGRTVTHEVGHYLGLRHVSGDPGFLGEDGCTLDDGISDTPNVASQSSFDCNNAQNTCTDAADDQPDMIENFMDYSSETCQNSFTLEQIGIMRAVLADQRSSLPRDVTSTSNLELEADVFMQPNPSEGLVTFKVVDETTLNYDLTVYNTLGERVFANTLTANQYQSFDFSHLAVGVYYVSISQDNRQTTKRLVLGR